MICYTASSGEFEGIKRLNVFMFFEEINMLLPVETFHDEATNTVYTTTDRMGTYCLMDVEIWLSNLGIEPIVENSVEKAEFSSGYSSITKKAFYSTPNSYKDNFDVAFLIDSRINSHEKFIEIKKSILDICDIIFNVSPNARVRFVQLMPVERSDINFYQAITDDNGNEFCTDYGAVNDALAKVEQLKNIEGIKKKDILLRGIIMQEKFTININKAIICTIQYIVIVGIIMTGHYVLENELHIYGMYITSLLKYVVNVLFEFIEIPLTISYIYMIYEKKYKFKRFFSFFFYTLFSFYLTNDNNIFIMEGL